jgi:two-component system chemotaxis response regulator CheB
MMLENHHIQLWRGPKESGHRPAVNTLFRSAAITHRERVAGIVLSGTLDDGTTGLWWIKRHGGVAVVQDPEDATFPEMAYSALEHVEVDHILPAYDMAELILELSGRRSMSRENVGE